MATYYNVSLAGWDSSSSWSDTSGGANGFGPPGDGDIAIFDANSPGVSSGPSFGISLYSLVIQNYVGSLPFPTFANITISNSLAIDTGTFDGILGSNITATFSGDSVCQVSADYYLNTCTFTGNASNNSTALVGTVIFEGTSTNDVNISVGSAQFSQSSSNLATVSCVGLTIMNTATIDGDISANTVSIHDTPVSNISVTITATTSITLNVGCVNSYFDLVCPTVYLLASSTNNKPVVGNIIMSAGSNNTATCSGSITAPGSKNGDGTWGYNGLLGSFSSLKLTGIGGGINGSSLLGLI